MKNDSKEPKKIKLFVYGTLQRGYGLNRRLRKCGARFLGRDKTRDNDFVMLAYGVPYVVRVSEEEKKDEAVAKHMGQVIGEVWEIELDKVGPIDSVEGGYTRTAVMLESGDEAFIYLSRRMPFRTAIVEDRCFMRHSPPGVFTIDADDYDQAQRQIEEWLNEPFRGQAE